MEEPWLVASSAVADRLLTLVLDNRICVPKTTTDLNVEIWSPVVNENQGQTQESQDECRTNAGMSANIVKMQECKPTQSNAGMSSKPDKCRISAHIGKMQESQPKQTNAGMSANVEKMQECQPTWEECRKWNAHMLLVWYVRQPSQIQECQPTWKKGGKVSQPRQMQECQWKVKSGKSANKGLWKKWVQKTLNSLISSAGQKYAFILLLCQHPQPNRYNEYTDRIHYQ